MHSDTAAYQSAVHADGAGEVAAVSIKVMNAVFERYPVGGGEMLLALALADHASDDGTRVFPSIRSLAVKTRQSERSVQYQLRKMEESEWLVLVNAGNGGRGQNREYRISLDWIKGADIAPLISAEKGADIAPFEGAERVQSTTVKGATDDTKGATSGSKGCRPLHPHITVINSQEPSDNSDGVPAQALDTADIAADVLEDFLKMRAAKRSPLTNTAIKGLRREADKAGLTLTEAMEVCCEQGWQAFNAGWYAQRQAKNQIVTPSTAAAGQRAETPYQRSMRERVAEFSPAVARSAPGPIFPTLDAENVAFRRIN